MVTRTLTKDEAVKCLKDAGYAAWIENGVVRTVYKGKTGDYGREYAAALKRLRSEGYTGSFGMKGAER